MQPRSGRRRLTLLGLVPLAVAAAVFLPSALSATSSGHVQPLHGHMRNIMQIGCGSATGVCSIFEASGSINGSGIVSVDTFPDASKLGFSAAHTVIHTDKGDLTCHEAALFDLAGADHAFVDLCVIDGGTGAYAGASGYIREAGTFDFAANLGELTYDGKLLTG